MKGRNVSPRAASRSRSLFWQRRLASCDIFTRSFRESRIVPRGGEQLRPPMIRPLLARDRDRYPPYRCPSPKRASLTFSARFARPSGPRKPHPRGPPGSPFVDGWNVARFSRYLLRHSVNSRMLGHYFNIIRNEVDKRGDPLCRNFRRNCHYQVSTRIARSCARLLPSCVLSLSPLSLSLSLSLCHSLLLAAFFSVRARRDATASPSFRIRVQMRCTAYARYDVEGDLGVVTAGGGGRGRRGK